MQVMWSGLFHTADKLNLHSYVSESRDAFFLVKNNLECFYQNNYFSCKYFLWKFSFAYTAIPINKLQTFGAFAIV